LRSLTQINSLFRKSGKCCFGLRQRKTWPKSRRDQSGLIRLDPSLLGGSAVLRGICYAHVWLATMPRGAGIERLGPPSMRGGAGCGIADLVTLPQLPLEAPWDARGIRSEGKTLDVGISSPFFRLSVVYQTYNGTMSLITLFSCNSATTLVTRQMRTLYEDAITRGFGGAKRIGSNRCLCASDKPFRGPLSVRGRLARGRRPL
jgi:hypothetical protein